MQASEPARKVVDFHSHLGDILHPAGGELIAKKNVKKKIMLDVISIAEWVDYQGGSNNEGASNSGLFERLVIKAERARNATATLENCKRTMEEAGIVETVCLPIYPHLTFDDLYKAKQDFSGIIPFTGVDFTKPMNLDEKFSSDIERGAEGLKLHPNLQMVALTDQRTIDVVTAFSKYRKPILFHCGISSYYLGKDHANEAPLYGRLKYARELVANFPDVPFVAGHAGMFQVEDTMRLLGEFKNVWVDTSFQSAKRIKQLIEVFGEKRILFGSDWPYGTRTSAVRIMNKVCRNNRQLADQAFSENAAQLLGGDW